MIPVKNTYYTQFRFAMSWQLCALSMREAACLCVCVFVSVLLG